MANGQEEAAETAAASASATAASRSDTPEAAAAEEHVEEEWEEEDDLEWESGDDGGPGEGAAGQGGDTEYEEEDDEDDEDLLRFLRGAEAGGGIEVELDGGRSGSSRADEAAAAGGKGTKAVVRTAKELRRDFRVHTAHLALLLHRARLVSRYADDGAVQTLALSLAPADLASIIGERKDHSLPTVTRLAEWFQDAFRALPDADVDESEGKEGSPPARLLRVLEQRAGSGHELVQAFAATCRALGLPARYVCPLDPRSYQNPPYLKLRKKALKDGQGRPLVDLTQADEDEEDDEEDGSQGEGKGKGKGKKKRRRGLRGAKALLSARYGLKPLNGSWVWCEVRCTEPSASPSPSSSPPGHPRKKKKGKSAQASSSSSAAAAATASPIIHILSSSSSEDEGTKGGKGKKRRRQREEEQEGGGAGATRSRWVQVDVLRRMVDRPSVVETLQPGGARRLLLYVVGVEGRGKKGAGRGGGAGQGDAWVTDVTRRYAAARWSRVVQCRAGSWWQQHLRRVNRRARRRHEQRLLDGDFRGYYAREGTRRAEEEELRQAEEAQPMPTSLEGFKRHPKFVLERHLGRWDVVYPRKVVGMFKGEAVFERQNVHEGATATQWRRNGRVVREGEKPARVVAVKGGKGKGKRVPPAPAHRQQQRDEGEEREEGEAGGGEAASVASGSTQGTGEPQRAVELYGFWQTEKYQPPALLEGGRLPINEHGNIEVLGGNRAFLPQGTVHRTERGLWQVAKQLGIQYAPALTGFEVKNGRSVPVIEGVVVLQRDEAALLDAYMAFAAQKEEKAARAREKKILDRWVRLLKGLRIQRDIKNKYGGGGGGGGGKKKPPPSKASHSAAAAAGGGVAQGGSAKKRPRVVVEVEDGEATESEGEGHGK